MNMDKSRDTAAAAPPLSRRRLLYATTAGVAAVGFGAALWPLAAQFGPDAAARADDGIVDVDLSALPPGTQRVVRWRDMPIFIAARTAAMLTAMHDESFEQNLTDAHSDKHQQPGYAKNWHRSLDPTYAVLVGVCTRCSCSPTYMTDLTELVIPGGYICPCCAARYDPAGRAYAAITYYNLPVPPYDIVRRTTLRIGGNAHGERFTLKSVERI